MAWWLPGDHNYSLLYYVTAERQGDSEMQGTFFDVRSGIAGASHPPDDSIDRSPPRAARDRARARDVICVRGGTESSRQPHERVALLGVPVSPCCVRARARGGHVIRTSGDRRVRGYLSFRGGFPQDKGICSVWGLNKTGLWRERPMDR